MEWHSLQCQWPLWFKFSPAKEKNKSNIKSTIPRDTKSSSKPCVKSFSLYDVENCYYSNRNKILLGEINTCPWQRCGNKIHSGARCWTFFFGGGGGVTAVKEWRVKQVKARHPHVISWLRQSEYRQENQRESIKQRSVKKATTKFRMTSPSLTWWRGHIKWHNGPKRLMETYRMLEI